MRKLEWRWELPSGETVEARLEQGVESVYVGPRLASRSSTAGKPEGHDVDVGGRAMRVAFNRAAHECTCTVDGAPIAPVARPAAAVVMAAPPTEYRASRRLTWPLFACGGAVFALLAYLGLAGFHSPAALWERVKGESAPFFGSHSTPDGTLIAHYPVDFSVIQGNGGTMLLGRTHSDQVFVFFSAQPERGLDAQGASDDLVTRFVAVLAERGVTYTQQWSGLATCHGQSGVEALGALHKDGEGKLRTCAFLENGYEYFVAYGVESDRVYEDEPLLQRIAAGVTLVDPAKLRRYRPGIGGTMVRPVGSAN